MSRPDAVAALTPSMLVGTVLAASAERQPDLSRSTYRELLSSGRIDLIQALDVRVALGNYDRGILETEAVWEKFSPNLLVWSWSRIPNAVVQQRNEACSVNAAVPLFTIPEICEFDLGGWPAEGLRQDVMSLDARQRMLLAGSRFRTGIQVIDSLRRLAIELAAALTTELADT